MKVEQLYTNCLAHGAYYIESNGEAAIIDPLREIQEYIEMAESRGAKIKYIFETHFHADFVSGHKDLAEATGATIVYGPTTMETGYDIHVGKDDEIFILGKSKIRLLHTPGHTTESSCYLLINEEGKEEAIFTGDTLFIGDVGRPDLAQKVIAELTETKLAKMLYSSLRDKIMPLNDEIIVYPGHGAGSACGKNMSKETSDTLGNQKKSNYALRADMSEDEFIKELLDGLTPPPAYFPQNVLMNIKGYESINEVLKRGTSALSIVEFENLAKQDDVIIVDTRHQNDFVNGFIPGSVFIGIKGNFATWVGTVIKDVNQKIVFIADEGSEEEVATRFARVGFDNLLGYLDGSFKTWNESGKEVASIPSISVKEFSERAAKGKVDIIDARKESEYNSHHVVDAKNIPLDYLEPNEVIVDNPENTFVHCAGGYRSVIFLSLLAKVGKTGITNVEGGFSSIEKENKLELTEYVCPTTLL